MHLVLGQDVASLLCWGFVWLNDCAYGDEADFSFIQTQKAQSLSYLKKKIVLWNKENKIDFTEGKKFEYFAVIFLKLIYLCYYKLKGVVSRK